MFRCHHFLLYLLFSNYIRNTAIPRKQNKTKAHGLLSFSPFWNFGLPHLFSLLHPHLSTDPQPRTTMKLSELYEILWETNMVLRTRIRRLKHMKHTIFYFCVPLICKRLHLDSNILIFWMFHFIQTFPFLTEPFQSFLLLCLFLKETLSLFLKETRNRPPCSPHCLKWEIKNTTLAHRSCSNLAWICISTNGRPVMLAHQLLQDSSK